MKKSLLLLVAVLGLMLVFAACGTAEEAPAEEPAAEEVQPAEVEEANDQVVALGAYQIAIPADFAEFTAEGDLAALEPAACYSRGEDEFITVYVYPKTDYADMDLAAYAAADVEAYGQNLNETAIGDVVAYTYESNDIGDGTTCYGYTLEDESNFIQFFVGGTDAEANKALADEIATTLVIAE